MKKFKSRSISAIMLAVSLYFGGSLIYMNLRAPDALLQGWQDYDKQEFSELLEDRGSALVEVYASWCSTCLAQHRAFENLIAEGRPPQIQAIRVDFEKDTDFRQQYGINYTGALLLFKDGTIVASAAGLVTPDSIHGFLDQHGFASAKVSDTLAIN